MELDKVNAELALTAWEDTQAGRDTVQLLSQQIAHTIDSEIMQTLNDISVSMAIPQEMMAGEGEIIATLPHVEGGQLIGASDEWKWVSAEPIKYEIAPAQEMNFTLAAVPSDNAVSVFKQPENSLIVEIKRSGEVTLGKDVDPKFAAHEFWTRLAEIGGEFEKRFDELEEDFDNEQSMRLELEEIITDIASALGVPQLMEHDIADHAMRMKDQLEEVMDVLQKVRKNLNVPEGESIVLFTQNAEIIAPKQTTLSSIENPSKAYERAMKVVR